MTGTAVLARRELKATYAASVSSIPTNRPCIREVLAPRIFATLELKRRAIADEVAQMHALGRAVLVGTPSVDASEALGRLLAERGIPPRDLERPIPRERGRDRREGRPDRGA